MEKVVFQAPHSGESMEFYVVEQTRINGVNYLLVTEEEDGDCDAFILKEISQEENEDIVYEMVESEEELEYMSRIFGEILEDVELTM
ncbi:hypothetical protein C805_01643 [Eubacterium sp. 14-2]|uniref:DUF1292 domain-containing protein n=1 Tax=Eubacterium sp. 14-2 TaxID=1235790 RepID=UPI0003406236|nr:DUF1292 domain-containing protein [Eubacterium sp. 14-2]EOT27535.1 hypothetical protein C805_01643 [Eubacterium sp. 14-2]